MLDIRKIKENPDAVKAGLKAKEVDCDAVIDRILELDVEIRGLKTTSEGPLLWLSEKRLISPAVR